jgi:hypothetical protein
VSVSALAKLAARVRGDLVPSCSFVSLVLAAVVCGHSQAWALAATEPIGGGIETTINPPRANRLIETPTLDRPAAPVLSGNPLWAIPLRSLSVTRERPLFSPSRRPPPSAVVAAPAVLSPQPPRPAEPDHPLLTLVGTIVGKTQSVGIFIDQVKKNVIRLKTGQDHAGWTLRAIQGREAAFEKDQRTITLALPARSATSQAGASVPALTAVLGRPAGSWLDGDGRAIGPPPLQWNQSAPVPTTWIDGDGQSIAPPSPAPVGKTVQH